ncbi:carbon-nitrogen family hydrolase [Bacillus sp. T3]|uniref:carbon-nitrogen family hydrolase n=1 Tax=Bacillus sp. T3 TaxID=467262 RepID=UPI002980FAF7|nr:carbon-nitrogen family hydrolase [Bacillus sp. T3]
MKIACVQMDIDYANPQKNYEVAKKYIEECSEAGADVIVFPEMWNTGYALDVLNELADQNGEKTKSMLSSLAKHYRINIVAGSVATKKATGFYNTMYVVNRNGKIVAEYDKAHLFKLMDEHQFINEGQQRNVFELDGTICGGVICYDLRFPEWIRLHVLAGAKIMFIPAQWPKPRIDHWRILLQARAIENQCYIVGVNRIGSDPNNQFNGHTMVIAPWGELLLSDNQSEGVFYVELNLNEVDSVRKTIPIFEDRRTDLY